MRTVTSVSVFEVNRRWYAPFMVITPPELKVTLASPSPGSSLTNAPVGNGPGSPASIAARKAAMAGSGVGVGVGTVVAVAVGCGVAVDCGVVAVGAGCCVAVGACVGKDVAVADDEALPPQAAAAKANKAMATAASTVIRRLETEFMSDFSFIWERRSVRLPGGS